MKLYNGTGCLVQLIGTLFSMPLVSKNNSHHTTIVVNRQRVCADHKNGVEENYHVIINQHDTQRILKFGFPGMLITIHGDFDTENKAAIIAEKIDFMNYPNADQSQIISKNIGLDDFKKAEKSYWFNRQGIVREELTYIH
ncbi:MAG: hypothetical protein A3C44_01560 [Gammaproteobacteria bacterium RIFCSPHIGHO2_02_FULL_39_13]|nr:MAG: hypothetical protein A3C44_01560 [Gammaproteobacteria bacterium RIFCSPHIGHO2_02_FULL_39_13]OGT49573.1 MAG: hypothetical protein A3E53_00305 [Gammaproteobacteria bacterium RIFCSPHIGHO2_12_FULL_39_24]